MRYGSPLVIIGSIVKGKAGSQQFGTRPPQLWLSYKGEYYNDKEMSKKR